MKRLTKLRKFSAAALAFAMLLASGCGSSVTASPSVEPSAEPTEDPDPTVIVIPAPEGENFGLVAEEYDLLGGTPTAITVGNVTGDTDVLDFVELRLDLEENLSVGTKETFFELVFDAELPVAFTTEKWEDGEKKEDEAYAALSTIERNSYIEKYSGKDRWERYSALRLHESTERIPIYPVPGKTYGPSGEKFVMPDDEGRVCTVLPVGEPGIYRYTLYFRESIDNTVEHCTTGDELYSVSFELTIPKSDRDFDVLGVCGEYVGGDWENKKSGSSTYFLYVLMRPNFDPGGLRQWLKFGMDLGSARLEALEDGEWREVEGGIIVHPDDENAKIETTHTGVDYFGGYTLRATLPEGRYRLVTEFVDGSRRYDLTICFTLGESGE